MSGIFSNKTREYVLNDMCINVKIYEDRIMRYAQDEQDFFNMLGDMLVLGDINALNGSALALFDKFEIAQDGKQHAYDIGVALLNALKAFRQSGLLELYVYADTDEWAPLPKITKSLYSEMSKLYKDIYDSLPDILTIYRGTNLSEYNSGKYGQSWSLSREVAYRFAQDIGAKNNSKLNRVVLESEINKANIFAYHNYGLEELCIVNTSKFTIQPRII